MAEIHTCVWTPAGVPVSHLVLVHGYGEYSERYGPIANRLAEAGIQVHGFDHPGHGRSAGRRGHIERFDALVDNLAEQVETVIHSAGGKPVFLLAHSMGGLVAVHYLARSSDAVSGAVISSPFLALPPEVPSWKIRASAWLGRWAPWLPVGRVDVSAISRDPDVVAAAKSDPLMHHGSLNARTGAQLLDGIRGGVAALSSVRVPLLVLHGTADRIAPFAAGERLYQEASSADRACYWEEGGYHELLNDMNREKVERVILDWLQERVSRSQAGG